MSLLSLFSTPVIQAPMAGVQDSKLAIAVSKAGGLGSIPCAMLSAQALRAELEALQQAGVVYNANFFCHQPQDASDEKIDQWQQQLSPYYRELDISGDNAGGAKRQPFSHAIADIIEPYCPPVISFHFGLPEDDLLSRVKSWGSKILSTATTVAEAKFLESKGVDAIIAQGFEAGGHRGHFLNLGEQDLDRPQLPSLALIPQIVAAVSVPVIAAGGIVDKASQQAALTLGACAVQVGSSYLLCHETNTSELHRAAIKNFIAKPEEYYTAQTNVFSGRPARGIVNRVIRELGPFSAAAPPFPAAAQAIGPLRAAAEKIGSHDFTPLWCGQNPSGCREVSAADITASFG